MADGKKRNQTDVELRRLVLDEIWRRGEVMQSELYHLTPTKGRIEPLLIELTEAGILSTRTKVDGQKVPLYSYSMKGRMFYMASRLANEIADSGELDLEAGEMSEIYGNLKRHFGVEFDD